MADERPARKVFVIALMNVAIMIAEVRGRRLWYGMTGIDIIDYDNTRAHLGEFAIMHAVHLVLMIALFAALRSLYNAARSAGSMNLRLFPLVSGRAGSSADGSPDCRGVCPPGFQACSSTACRCLRSGASSWMRCCSLRWTATLASGMRISEPRCCRVSWMRVLRSAMRSYLEVEQTARMRHDVRKPGSCGYGACRERRLCARARDHISSFRSLYLPM